MSDSIEILFLGTGTSHGIPMIGCDCAVCRSTDPRDKRNRTSVAVRLPDGPPTDGQVILIDAPPELRIAAVANNLERIDAMLLTHAHADHVMGTDDLRRYNNIAAKTISCFGNAKEIQVLRSIFGYAERPYLHPDRPSLAFRALAGGETICGAEVTPVPLMHGKDEILGFRIGRFAYCTDCSGIPPASRPLLADLDVLVLGALRRRPHPAHFNLEEALATVEETKPRRTLLTHIAHELAHASTSAELPSGVELAYDGLRVRAEG